MVNGNLALSLIKSENEITIQESPIKWSSISLSDVVARGKRLEASVFDVEAKHAREILNNGKYPLTTVCGKTGLANAYTCARFKRIWVKKSKFPIYQPSSILDIKPTPDGYISSKTKVNIDSLRVSKGQILMTCSGTIGKIAYVSDTLDNLIFSHDLLRITCKELIDAGYLYTYFKSYIGQKILTTSQYGAVISHIEPEHLLSVPVPNPDISIKTLINKLIVASFSLRDKSNELINIATQKLIDELKLPPLDEMIAKNNVVNTFSVKLSNLATRADASYHVPVVNDIIKHLKKYAAEITTVADPRISQNVTLPGRFKRVYVEEGQGYPFIGGKQINELDPSNKKYLSKVKHSKRIKNELLLNEGTTLITRSGTIGKVALVPKHWEKWVASEHIIRVVPANKEIAGYLNIFLSSDYGYQLIKRYTYGSVVDEIDDNQVRQIIIPLLKNQEVQKEINDLVLEANAKRYEAYCLEQQALKIMNEQVIFAK